MLQLPETAGAGHADGEQLFSNAPPTAASRPSPARRAVQRAWRGARKCEPHVGIRIVFLLLLAVVAALAIAAMVTVTPGLTQSYQDTLTVYVGGAALYFTQIGYTDLYRMRAAPTNRTEQVAAVADLLVMTYGLTYALDLIQFGNKTTALTNPTTSPEIESLFEQLQEPVNTTLEAITVIQTMVLFENASIETPAVAAAVDRIFAVQPLVTGLQRELLVQMTIASVEAVDEVRRQQYIFMGVVLGALLLITLLVYVPVERRTRRITRAITEKNAELSRLSYDLTAVMQLSPNGIFCADDKGRITFANERWDEITGLAPHERDSWLRLVHEEDRATIADQWAHELRQPKELRMVKHGQVRWLLLQCRYDNTPYSSRHVIASIMDITENKRLALERLDILGSAADAAEQHRQEQEVFVDSICHGIRNPLNGIVNNVDLLRDLVQQQQQRIELLTGAVTGTATEDGAATFAEAERALSAIEQCANHQRIITNDVLNFSRLKSQKLKLEVVSFRLGDLVDGAIIMFAAEAKAEGIQLTSQLEVAAAGLILRNDRERLMQILSNLLSNSIKFTRNAPAGRRHIVLTASVSVASAPRPSTTGSVTASVEREVGSLPTSAPSPPPPFSPPSIAADGKAEATGRAPSADAEAAIVARQSNGASTSLERKDVNFTTSPDGSSRPSDVFAQQRPDAGGLTEPATFAPAPGTAVQLRLAVRDSGVGISKADRRHLFQRFGQVGSAQTRTSTGSSGLGLSICKLLVDLMGGTILVHSELGRGAEFEVRVPSVIGTTAAPDQVTTTATAGPAPATAPGHLGGRTEPPLSRGFIRMLVVDDNAVNQTVLKRQLELSSTEALRFITAVASNGQDALDLLESHDFDVILMDIEMPVMNGIEATRALRARGSVVPVIGLSGNARQEHVDVALASGMQAYVVKPYSRQELVRLILRQCGMPVP